MWFQPYQPRAVFLGDEQRRVQARASIEVVCHGPAQQVARPEIARAHRDLRDSKRRGGFFDTELLYRAHQEHRPKIVGKRADARFEQLPHFAALRGRLGPGFPGHQVIGFHVHSSSGLGVTPPPHQRLIRRDPHEPGGEFGLAAERSQCAKRLEIGFLDSVFRLCVIAQDGPRSSVKRSVVRAHQRFERAHVARQRLGDELGIGH